MRRSTAAAIVGGAAVLGYLRFVGPWQRRWGATDDEVTARVDVDRLVGDPASQVTRAITIDATPDEVWPWLVQIGADRGGFYSYDRLENLFGLGIHSADEIVEEWQSLRVGDVVAANRARTGGWYVQELRPAELMALQTGDLRPCDRRRRGRPAWWSANARRSGPRRCGS